MVLPAIRSIVRRRALLSFAPFANGLALLGLLGRATLLTMRLRGDHNT
jgi:hypothetical protein